jgi:hypothetical protein
MLKGHANDIKCPVVPCSCVSRRGHHGLLALDPGDGGSIIEPMGGISNHQTTKYIIFI